MTKVLPRLRMLNMAGALTSYQSFLEKGSTLHDSNKQKYTVHWSAQTTIQTGLYSRLASRLATSKPAKHALKRTLNRASMPTWRLFTSNVYIPHCQGFAEQRGHAIRPLGCSFENNRMILINNRLWHLTAMLIGNVNVKLNPC